MKMNPKEPKPPEPGREHVIPDTNERRRDLERQAERGSGGMTGGAGTVRPGGNEFER